MPPMAESAISLRRAGAGVEPAELFQLAPAPRGKLRLRRLWNITAPSHAETEGLQRAQDIVGGARHDPGRVEVLHAHQPFAAATPGIKKAAHRRDQRAEMQRPGRRRRETATILEDFGFHKRLFCPRR